MRAEPDKAALKLHRERTVWGKGRSNLSLSCLSRMNMRTCGLICRFADEAPRSERAPEAKREPETHQAANRGVEEQRRASEELAAEEQNADRTCDTMKRLTLNSSVSRWNGRSA
jgi:hypothetical protein